MIEGSLLLDKKRKKSQRMMQVSHTALGETEYFTKIYPNDDALTGHFFLVSPLLWKYQKNKVEYHEQGSYDLYGNTLSEVPAV